VSVSVAFLRIFSSGTSSRLPRITSVGSKRITSYTKAPLATASTSVWLEHSPTAMKTHPGCSTPCSGKPSKTESSFSLTCIAPISNQPRDYPRSFKTSTPGATLQVYNVPGLLSPVCNTCLEPHSTTFDCYTPTEWAGSTASPSLSSAPFSVLPPSLLTVPGRAPTIRMTSDGTVVNNIYPECPYVLQPNIGSDIRAFPAPTQPFLLGINDQRGDELPLRWDPNTITRYRFRYFEQPSHHHTVCIGGTPHLPCCQNLVSFGLNLSDLRYIDSCLRLLACYNTPIRVPKAPK
jgi:hypothetical protein